MFLRTKSKRSRFATVAILLAALLYLPVSGAVSHYCYDGLEPPVSIHFDNFSGHESHDDSEQHQDLEKRVLDDNLVGELLDLQLAINLGRAHADLDIPRAISFRWMVSASAAKSSYWHLNPPLRAPPHNS